jgi:acetylornithine aminotransferase/acetylornithine/N-succinyldiaminopimelate aminotransferase
MVQTAVSQGTGVADAVRNLDREFVLEVYRRSPLVFVRGEGVRLYDADGREFLDLISGIGVASLGHSHPRLVQELHEQMQTLMHCSNLFHHPLQGQVAEQLAHLSGLQKTFFCNSGTEAIEACFKLARRFWYTRGDTGRRRIVALERAFHGRTFGSLSLTWDTHYRTPFEPLLGDVTFVPANDVAALRAAVSDSTVAIIAEAIQGEGGVTPLTAAFAHAINEASARSGALVIADEVQCGLGRTGYPFHYAAIGLKPHLVAVGKALGSGIPVAAALASREVADAVSFGDHGSTYGGNLVACRAALVFLDELVGKGLLAQVGRVGAWLEHQLKALAARHPSVVAVRGCGLMWGLELASDAGPVVDAARERGLLINRTAERVVRLLPPLVITETDLASALEILEGALTAAASEASA